MRNELALAVVAMKASEDEREKMYILFGRM